MLAVDDHRASVDHHIGDIGCGSGEDDVLGGRLIARGADRINLNCNEVRSCTDDELTGVRPAESAVAVEVAARNRRSAAMVPRVREAKAFVELTARASSNRSITAWLSEPRLNSPRPASSAGAGPMPSPRSRSVVGQKHTPGRCSMSAMSLDVRWVACTAVVRGPNALIAQHRCRRAAMHRQVLLTLAGLLRGANVQRGSVCGSPFHDGRHVFDGMLRTLCSAAPTKTDGVTPTCCRSASTRSAHRSPFRRRTAAGVRSAVSRPLYQIAGVEQGEADAGVGSAVDYGLSHGIRFGVVGAAGVVVHVMEFADGGNSGERDLRADRAGELPVPIGVELLGGAA